MKKNRNEIVRNLALVTQLGISMLAPIILCAFVGVWLDDHMGWSVTAVLLILGVCAGARNTWVLLKAEIKPDLRKRKKDER